MRELKKKIKYEDEIDKIRLNKYIREAEEDLEENECKVIEFKKYKNNKLVNPGKTLIPGFYLI